MHRCTPQCGSLPCAQQSGEEEEGGSAGEATDAAAAAAAAAARGPVLWKLGWGKRRRLAAYNDGGDAEDGEGGHRERTLRISVKAIEDARGAEGYVHQLIRRAADNENHFEHIVRVDATLCSSLLHVTPQVMCRFAHFLSTSLSSLSELVLNGCGIETPAAHRILLELGRKCWSGRPDRAAAAILDLSGNAIHLLDLCQSLQQDGVSMGAVGTLLFCEQSCGVDDRRTHAAQVERTEGANWARALCATFPRLVRLHLSRNTGLTGEFVHEAVKGLPQLQEIALDGCTGVTQKGLSYVRCALAAVAESTNGRRQPASSSAAASASSPLETAPRLHISMRGVCSTTKEWARLIREAARLRTLRNVDVLLLHDVTDRTALADSGGAIGLGGGRGHGGRSDRAKAAAAIRNHAHVRVVFCGQLRLPGGQPHIVLQSRDSMPADRCIVHMATLAEHALTLACMTADAICPSERRQPAVSKEFHGYVEQLRNAAVQFGIMGSTFKFFNVNYVEMLDGRGGVRLRCFGPVQDGVLLPPPEDGDRAVQIFVYTKRQCVDA